MKAMIIEDDPRINLLLKKVLENVDFKVTTFFTANDAIKAYKKEFYPIIITDIAMPGMNGLEFCKQVRSLPQGPYSVILVETAFTQKVNIAAAINAGADDYITKPIDIQLLKARLAVLMNLYKERREKVSAQNTIKESEAKLKTIFNSSQQSFILIDKSYNILAFNKKASKRTKVIYGIKLCEGANVNHILPKKEVEVFRSDFLKALQGKTVIIDRCFKGIKGGTFWFTFSYNPVLTDDNQILGVSISITDITRRKLTEEALKRSEKNLREAIATKDKFFSIIAHDLKNPLTILIGFPELLCENNKSLKPGKLASIAENIRDASRNLLNLLENLLEWSRLQMGRFQFNPEKTDLAILSVLAVDVHQQSAIEKGIRLKSEIKKNTFVNVDKNMVTTIIRNLVSNSIKFTESGGNIRIVSSDDDNFINVSVIDDGMGISKENLEKLFRIDVHHTTLGTSQEKGTGLGLILCKEFIEKHGGKIWVESILGQGSTFNFTLPKSKKN